MANGVLIVVNEDTNEMLTMPLDNVTVSAEDYAGILADDDSYAGTITIGFSKTTDRYNAIRATPTYDDNL